MPDSCYLCRYLLQGGYGSNGCAKFGEPGYPETPRQLDDNPVPLYEDCFEPFTGGEIN